MVIEHQMSTQHPLISHIMTLIEVRAGLLLREPHRTLDAQQAITRTLKETGLRDLEMLYNQLQQSDVQHPMWQKLLQMLTIGETYFFRNQAHFNAMRDEILPQLIERKRERGHQWLRIWSAGCATGEEIYSIAIMLREMLPDYRNWSLYLVGTDINDAYLEQARQGLYRDNSFRSETPTQLGKDWFTRQGAFSKLDASIRNMVLFKTLNLVTDEYPTLDATLRLMDIVLCQNVTIYFDRPTTEKIQVKLIDTLAEDGWLILGHSEPLFVKTPLIKVRNFTNAIVFQRQPAPPTVLTPTEYPARRIEPTRSKPAAAPAPKPATRPLPSLPSRKIHNTDHVEELRQQAQQAADNKAWSEALQLLETLIQIQPLNEYAHYLRGLIYMEQGQPDQALNALWQAIYCNSNFILAHYLLGELSNQLGNLAQAKREWRLAQNLIAQMAPHDIIPHTTDLSVEMLNGLLSMQLSSGGLRS